MSLRYMGECNGFTQWMGGGGVIRCTRRIWLHRRDGRCRHADDSPRCPLSFPHPDLTFESVFGMKLAALKPESPAVQDGGS